MEFIYSQVADFVGSYYDAAEATRVLYYGDRVHFFESLVDDAGSTDVGETCTRIKFVRFGAE